MKRRAAWALAGGVITLVLSVALLGSFDYAASGGAGLLVLGTVACGALSSLIGRLRHGTWMTATAATLVAAPVMALLIFTITVRLQRSASFRRGDTIISALEAYRSSSGSYPVALEDLVPTHMPTVPLSAMGVLGSVPFTYSRDDRGGFLLGFPAPSFMLCAAHQAGQWSCDD
ncbi:MAG: hypothetical protein ACREAA_02510 [Candidatus Polarisedimenticolia bacterium]